MVKSRTASAKYFSYLFEKKVKIIFIDGKLLAGKLVSVDQYELMIEREEDGKPVSVFKGSIKYMYLNE